MDRIHNTQSRAKLWASARRVGLLWPVAAALIAVGAQGETLQDALIATLRNNPKLEDARLAVRASKAARGQALSEYLPSLNVTATYGDRHLDARSPSIFGSATQKADLSPSTAALEAREQVYTGGRRGAEWSLSKSNINAERQAQRTVEQDVLLAAVTAYAEVLRDEQVAHTRVEAVEALSRQVDGSRKRLTAGEVTKTDLSQAQARLAGARAALAGARATLEATRARYKEIVGEQPGALAPPTAPTSLPATLEEALASASRAEPSLMQAREGERAARARVTIERSTLLPKVSISGRLDALKEQQYRVDASQSSGVAVELSMPLFDGGYGLSRVREQKINVQRAKAQIEVRSRLVTTAATAAWNDVSAAREVVEAAREQESANQAALAGAEREQGLGLRSTIEVLDAQRDLQDAQIARARAEANALIAAYTLLAATGDLNAESLHLSASD